MKKCALVFLCFLSVTGFLFSQSQKIRFVKGNIQEKTAAVREASASESEWLRNEAFSFVLNNKTLLGDDRDLEGLAVAAVLSIPNNYGADKTESERLVLVDQLINLFKLFSNSNTLQISVLSKYLSLKNTLPPEPLAKALNEYLMDSSSVQKDSGVVKSVINTLGYIGNNVSFTIFYNLLNDERYTNYYAEIEQALINLLPVSMNDALRIVHTKDIRQMRKLFDLVKKNKRISQNFLSEIAENVLSESILIVGNSSEVTDEIVALQMDSLAVLSENKWTRSSSVAVSFFELAKKELNAGAMTDQQMVSVITSLVNIAPIGSVSPLIAYLGELNGRKERGKKVSDEMVLAVINTLGAIGDKSAFDTLLAVTYLDYPEFVLSAAREALAGLRW